MIFHVSFLRILFDTCSVVVRKKDVFSEQLPKRSRRTTEERCNLPCQNLPKPAKTGHSWQGYFKVKDSAVYYPVLSMIKKGATISDDLVYVFYLKRLPDAYLYNQINDKRSINRSLG
jgi:hypothetical protein